VAGYFHKNACRANDSEFLRLSVEKGCRIGTPASSPGMRAFHSLGPVF
jgi:hypothetical protein